MVAIATDMEICNLLGVFYEADGCLRVADEHEGSLNVATVLEPVKGVLVHVLAHHRPPDPPLKDKWGVGCCYLEGQGHCHAGHHERPQWIYTFNAVGVLQLDDEGWVVESSEGASHAIRTDWLVGHRSQIVVVSMPDLKKMADKVREFDPSNLGVDPRIADLQDRASEIRDYLEEINKLKDKI